MEHISVYKTKNSILSKTSGFKTSVLIFIRDARFLLKKSLELMRSKNFLILLYRLRRVRKSRFSWSKSRLWRWKSPKVVGFTSFMTSIFCTRDMMGHPKSERNCRNGVSFKLFCKKSLHKTNAFWIYRKRITRGSFRIWIISHINVMPQKSAQKNFQRKSRADFKSKESCLSVKQNLWTFCTYLRKFASIKRETLSSKRYSKLLTIE